MKIKIFHELIKRIFLAIKNFYEQKTFTSVFMFKAVRVIIAWAKWKRNMTPRTMWSSESYKMKHNYILYRSTMESARRKCETLKEKKK